MTLGEVTNNSSESSVKIRDDDVLPVITPALMISPCTSKISFPDYFKDLYNFICELHTICSRTDTNRNKARSSSTSQSQTNDSSRSARKLFRPFLLIIRLTI